MSDSPIEFPPTTSPAEAARFRMQMPGCGLAAYLGVLLTIMALGSTMMLMSGLTILSSGEAARPTRLMYGGDVEPYLLGALRSAGLLRADEVPDAFHAEDWSGTKACALTRTAVLRVGPDGAYSLPFAAVATITENPDGVRIAGPWQPAATDIAGRPQTKTTTEVDCLFQPNDGGDRFASMIRGAHEQAGAPDPATAPTAP